MLIRIAVSEFHIPEQVEAEGDVATAFTLARILSNIPLSRGGPTSIVIYDIHALQVCPIPLSASCHICCMCKSCSIGLKKGHHIKAKGGSAMNILVANQMAKAHSFNTGIISS